MRIGYGSRVGYGSRIGISGGGISGSFSAASTSTASFVPQLGRSFLVSAPSQTRGTFVTRFDWSGEFLSGSVTRGTFERAVLTERNALLYWDFGAGIAPVRGGGRPRFLRSTSALGVDNRDALMELVRDAPRVQMATVGRERLVGILLERAAVNKCSRGLGFATSGLTGWSKTGAAGATLTAVSDSAALARSGLQDIVGDGYALRLDNSAGATVASAVNAAAAGVLGQHALSAYVRGSGVARVRYGASVAGDITLGPLYQRATALVNATGAGENLRVEVEPGGVAYIVLPQHEVGGIATSPIPNPGDATVARGMDQLYLDGAPTPGELRALYVRLLAGMTADGGVAGARIIELSDASALAPRLAIRFTAAGVDVLLDNGAAQATAAVAVPGIVDGTLLEVAVVLEPTGAGTLLAAARGEVAGYAAWAAPAGGLPSSWSRVWLNSSGTNAAGRTVPLTVKATDSLIAVSAPYWMEELRRFIVEPGGLALPPD